VAPMSNAVAMDTVIAACIADQSAMCRKAGVV
jgi:hypothetical protein